MKELSIEEKAKAYDNIIEKANKMHSENCEACQICIEEFIPELKESEDDVMRKMAIKAVYAPEAQSCIKSWGINPEDVISWLEKQGEQKIDDDDKAILENWEGIVKDNKEKWQLSDWFVEATSLLIQKVKRIENNENINIKGSRVMLNACINALRTVGHSNLSDWLEKQSEQKTCGQRQECVDCQFNYAGECKGSCAMKIGEQKSAGKVEPKFHKGEWITNGEFIWYIKKVGNGFYDLKSPDGRVVDDTISYVDEHFHLWTIEDAKDGDVLMGNAPFIFNGNLEGGIGCPGAHCGINTLGKFQIPTDKTHWTGHITTPATKEQRDTLMKAMDDAGYTFDFERKELKKIEQKPEWSGEDERERKHCIDFLNHPNMIKATPTIANGCKDWLKSLKERVQPKQEWSEEDEAMRNFIIKIMEVEHPNSFFSTGSFAKQLIGDAVHVDRIINWLKSLRPQNRWKPSDLPHWKKSTLPNDNTTGFNSDYFCHKGYYINYKKLFEKLPKDD